MTNPEQSGNPQSISDEELHAWYEDLVRLAQRPHPHVPPPVEPTIDLLREAYFEVVSWDQYTGREDHLDRQAGWHRALHKVGWTHR